MTLTEEDSQRFYCFLCFPNWQFPSLFLSLPLLLILSHFILVEYIRINPIVAAAAAILIFWLVFSQLSSTHLQMNLASLIWQRNFTSYFYLFIYYFWKYKKKSFNRRRKKHASITKHNMNWRKLWEFQRRVYKGRILYNAKCNFIKDFIFNWLNAERENEDIKFQLYYKYQ